MARVVLVASRIEGVQRCIEACISKAPWADQVRLVTLSECTAEKLSPEIAVGDPAILATELDGLPSVQWYQSTWAGVNVVLDKCVRRDFTCTRAGGIFGTAMSEYVLAHILWREKNMQLATQGKWIDHEHFRSCRQLPQLRLGILGYGSIGRDVAKAATALGMKVLGLTRTAHDPPSPLIELTQDMPRVFRECDYIVNLLPQTPSTASSLTREVLEAGRTRSPVFINCGRGSVVTPEVLLAALDDGLLSHAVLDVFVKEPLPEDSPLWQHAKVTVTPHIAALTTAPDIAALFADSLGLYLQGKPPQHIVDWDAGY